ncbi:MAG: glycine cleavage system protein GcvH [Deltaproteobacteria bacterium]|nr:glycine cleavage system protein GcvH [Deltaproteobacteria bacterium]
MSELSFPDDVRYSEDHAWVRIKGDVAVIGITDYAQKQLGDLTFVDLPEEGEGFEKGEEYGAVESSKAAVDLIIPLSGEVTAINQALDENPRLVNSSPYEEGWMIKVKIEEPEDLEDLMSAETYASMLQGME